MSWAEAMKEQADVAARDPITTDGNVQRSTTSTPWDPHTVWLTRVKQPRERAASRVAYSPESQVRERPD